MTASAFTLPIWFDHVATFVFRVLTIAFNWRTSAVARPAESDSAP